MNDRTVERSFLWLLGLSLLLHCAVAALVWYLPAGRPPPREPVFIDLQQMPELKQQPSLDQASRLSDRRQRTARETAPRGDALRDSPPRSVPPPARGEQPAGKSPPAIQPPRRESPVAPGSSAASLLKPRSPLSQPPPAEPRPQLFPGATRLAQLEESYRRKFENDIAEGDTRFLNSDDILFGSFLRRFEGAVYGVWRYPQEAAMKGIEGIVPVRITFNRRGEISSIRQLESSGARVLDEEVLRTLRAIGPVGGFPKGYDKDEFHLIAFFQYGGSRRSLR